jgi:hypothetical protein
MAQGVIFTNEIEEFNLKETLGISFNLPAHFYEEIPEYFTPQTLVMQEIDNDCSEMTVKTQKAWRLSDKIKMKDIKNALQEQYFQKIKAIAKNIASGNVILNKIKANKKMT